MPTPVFFGRVIVTVQKIVEHRNMKRISDNLFEVVVILDLVPNAILAALRVGEAPWVSFRSN